jgi:hypothetical protein
MIFLCVGGANVVLNGFFSWSEFHQNALVFLIAELSQSVPTDMCAKYHILILLLKCSHRQMQRITSESVPTDIFQCGIISYFL